MKAKVYLRLVPIYLLILALIILTTMSGEKVVTTIAETAGIDYEGIIVIDPGHGGEDGGAISCTGIPESWYNLEISMRLNDLLHLLGHQTIIIRTEDISIYTEGKTLAQKKISDLRHRVKIINETENALLVSIHQNIFSDSKYRGAQVFYADTEDSRSLAISMQNALAASLDPENGRKAQRSKGVYLMEHIKTNGILIECGFISNLEEECLLKDKFYQNKICCVIASVLSQYLTT